MFTTALASAIVILLSPLNFTAPPAICTKYLPSPKVVDK